MAAPERSAPEDAATTGTVIHRKVQLGRAEHQARAMSLAKAMRLTIAKVADEMFDMSVAVIGLRSETVSGDDLVASMATPGLLLLLDGPHRSRAAAVFDEAMVGALIQQQTMGKVLDMPEAGSRRLTPTDAAISAPFLNAVLSRAAQLPEDPAEQQLIEGFEFGAWVEDARVLCMALEAAEYEVMTLTLDISGGVRQGQIILTMPKADKLPDPADVAASGAREEGGNSPQLPPLTLSETVTNLNAELRIALSQVKMPLRELGELKVGSLLPLPQADFEKVRIQTLAGTSVGRGVLGQLEGVRAVQVETAATGPLQMKRRNSDRDDLDLPDISQPDRRQSPEQEGGNGTLPDVPATGGTSPAEPQTALPDPAELPALPDMADLPDLPDMSDLPDYADVDTLPQLGTG